MIIIMKETLYMDGYVFYLIRKFFENCINDFLQRLTCKFIATRCKIGRIINFTRKQDLHYFLLLPNKINEVEMH